MRKPLSFFAHKSLLGRRGAKTSFVAINGAPESTDVFATGVGVFWAVRATTFLVRVGAGATGAAVATFVTGRADATSSPNAARAETPPDAIFTTGKRTPAITGVTINNDNILMVI